MSSLSADFRKFTLKFTRPMGTSRGVLHERDTYILGLKDASGRFGLGECAPLKGLSLDDKPDFSGKLQNVCDRLSANVKPSEIDLSRWPALKFGLEAALIDLQKGGSRLLFDTAFVQGKRTIPINGLIVMSAKEEMLQQVYHKVEAGFDCIKIKVGALDFDAECELLREIRSHFPPEHIQLRLDANGAFEPETAYDKMQRLSGFRIHSVEQPIRPGQPEVLAELCAKSPIPIALDEELIGQHSRSEKQALLHTVMPHYIVLKPTLLGGLKACQEWMALASELNISSWITSALESNIGLNILSQWASTLSLSLHQGLGTGQLYQANFPSPLRVSNGHLRYDPARNWPELASLSDLELS